MIARSLNIPEIRFIPFKNKSSTHVPQTNKTLPSQLTTHLTQRNQIIDWLYRAQYAINCSRSTLFLSIALLDKLITFGYVLNDQNCELIGGTILLIMTKFNEVYPVTVRKLNALSYDPYNIDKYV